jgi:hypothetical protein
LYRALDPSSAALHEVVLPLSGIITWLIATLTNSKETTKAK